MNRTFFAISLIVASCSIALSGTASDQGGSEMIEAPRFETACPPTSEDARTKIESEVSHVLGDQLREYYGENALPINATVEPLVDSEHREVCEYLTRVHKGLIYKTSPRPDRPQPSYDHSVTFFEAGSFYFVLIDVNPELLVSHDPGMDRVATSMVDGPRVYLKDSLERVSDQKGFVYGPEHRKLVNEQIRRRLEDR